MAGKITYQGKPVEGATVVFTALASENDGRSAFGETDSNGAYVLSTAGLKRKGAIVGNYEVCVIKTIAVDKSGKPITYMPTTGEIRNAQDRKKMPAGPPKIKSVIPEKYNNPDAALLHATVKKGVNTIDFELTD